MRKECHKCKYSAACVPVGVKMFIISFILCDTCGSVYSRLQGKKRVKLPCDITPYRHDMIWVNTCHQCALAKEGIV